MTIAMELVTTKVCDWCHSRSPEDTEMIIVPVSWGEFKADLHFDKKTCKVEAEAHFDVLLQMYLEHQIAVPARIDRERNTKPAAKLRHPSSGEKPKRKIRPKGQSKLAEKRAKLDEMWSILEGVGFTRHRGHISAAEKEHLDSVGWRF